MEVRPSLMPLARGQAYAGGVRTSAAGGHRPTDEHAVTRAIRDKLVLGVRLRQKRSSNDDSACCCSPSLAFVPMRAYRGPAQREAASAVAAVACGQRARVIQAQRHVQSLCAGPRRRARPRSVCGRPSRLKAVGVAPEIVVLVLQRSPQPFYERVVHPGAHSILSFDGVTRDDLKS
jgi:hypothetical protein